MQTDDGDDDEHDDDHDLMITARRKKRRTRRPVGIRPGRRARRLQMIVQLLLQLTEQRRIARPSRQRPGLILPRIWFDVPGRAGKRRRRRKKEEKGQMVVVVVLGEDEKEKIKAHAPPLRRRDRHPLLEEPDDRRAPCTARPYTATPTNNQPVAGSPSKHAAQA
jgi:hypothetical protein